MSENKKNNFFMIIIGTLFLILGWSLLLSVGNDLDLSCNRTSDICSIRKTNLFNQKSEIISFKASDLKLAKLDNRLETGAPDKESFKIILITTRGNIDFGEVYTNLIPKKTFGEKVDSINEFINSNKNEFQVSLSGLGIKIASLIFFFVGVIILVINFKKFAQIVKKTDFILATTLFLTVIIWALWALSSIVG